MKIAIVCGAPSSEFLAPFTDESWEIWVLGNRLDHYLGKHRVTRVFEVHDNLNEHKDPDLYKQWLYDGCRFDKPNSYELTVGENFFADGKLKADHEHNWVKFDYKRSEELFGSIYLTSSPAYMISYAILQGATEIGLYGVDLSIGDHEYFWQRPCVEAWIGFAKGRGIKVTIPEVSHVGKSRYTEGRDWDGDTEVGVFSEEGFNALAEQHQESMDNIRKERQKLAIKEAAHDGAMQTYKHLAKVARAVEAKVEVNSLLETTVLR